ncbi:MAG TPA: carbohydrate-binding family 9-like protein [Chthoniobacteraceae bacterium]|nr:carbohydrate-binding family 9-like protein [Chthoniobacteraceae bacterium]
MISTISGCMFRLLLFVLIVWGGKASAHKAAVAPYRLDLSDFAAPSARVEEREGQRCLVATNRVILRHLPLPATELPLCLWVRIKPGSDRDRLILETAHEGRRTPLATLSGMTPGQWQWVALSPFAADKVRGVVRLDLVPSKESGRPLEAGAVVVSTRADLEPRELEAAQPLLDEAPWVNSYPVDTPPRLDASGDDPVWAQAVPVRDFLTFTTHQPASLETTVRFLHDERHLYVQWVVDEPLLRAAEMRIEELVTKAEQNDSVSPHDVLNDDACFLLLRPAGGASAYEFVSNSLGIFLDARLKAGDLWKHRDVHWNAKGVRLAQKRHEGRWIWEMAVAFEALAARPPAPGEVWQVALARLAPGRKEHAAWNPTGNGAHQPQQWGRLRFAPAGEAIPATVAAPLKELTPGRNQLSFKVRGGREPVAYTFIQADSGARLFSGTRLAGQQGNATHAFDVTDLQKGAVRWGLLDGATFEPIYRSAAAQMAVYSSEITLVLNTPGAYQVDLNETQVASGTNAKGERLALRLAKGANRLVLRTQAPKASARLEGEPGELFSNIWQVTPEDSPAGKKGTPQNGARGLALIGAESGTAMISQCTILSTHTVVWPVPDPALLIARGMDQPVTFRFNGLPGRDLEKWTTWVAIPEGVHVDGVSGFYGATRERQPKFEVTPSGTTTLRGETLALYRITADRPLFYDKVHPPGGRTGMFHLMLKVPDDAAGRALSHGRIYYWSQAGEGTVTERRQSFLFKTLPPVRGRQPREYVFELWGSNFGNLDSEAVRHQIFKGMQQAGFNLLVDFQKWSVEHGRAYGIDVRPAIKFAHWSIDLKPYLEANPGEQLVRHDGSRHPEWLCTSLLLNERWPVAQAAIVRLMKENGYQSACYDYEYSPWRGPHSCFCPRCLNAFGREKGIEEALSPEVIEARYRPQWDDYMARQAARVMARMRQAVKEAVPGGFLTVFSLPQSPRTVSVYGVDWRYVAEEGGADVVQIGTSGSWETMIPTSRAVGKTPIMYGVWIQPYQPDHLIPAQVATKAELLRRVLDSNYGVLFYDRATMDGASWVNIGEITRLVADHEPIFRFQRPEPVDDLPPRDAQWMRGKEEALLCLMNPDREERPFTVSLPPGTAEVRDYFSGQIVKGHDGVLQVKLPAQEGAVYVVRHP